ncbi:hypothetical protein PsYK624_161270 [Phanerochaete sordida]|uniref:Uncharacterized protein n=1 Tax=Phanerochaete sordida TaxID=48140 RepID=A0A9P3LLL5_9APHY|nr:hypothetical protein PsYK624_161270 [Phanerochaete sordida]
MSRSTVKCAGLRSTVGSPPPRQDRSEMAGDMPNRDVGRFTTRPGARAACELARPVHLTPAVPVPRGAEIPICAGGEPVLRAALGRSCRSPPPSP